MIGLQINAVGKSLLLLSAGFWRIHQTELRMTVFTLMYFYQDRDRYVNIVL